MKENRLGQPRSMGHQSGGMADDALLPAVDGDGGVPVEAHVADLLECVLQALLSDAPDRPNV